jgi:hypothetical protein
MMTLAFTLDAAALSPVRLIGLLGVFVLFAYLRSRIQKPISREREIAPRVPNLPLGVRRYVRRVICGKLVYDKAKKTLYRISGRRVGQSDQQYEKVRQSVRTLRNAPRALNNGKARWHITWSNRIVTKVSNLNSVTHTSPNDRSQRRGRQPEFAALNYR